MARNHGRILASLWQDPDFTDLDVGPQRLYMFLLSQPNLSHLGVLPLTERRWAKACAGLSVPDVQRDLALLAAARFVVVDEDTEELLVRTLIRNDNVYKQPNTLKAAIAAVPAVASSRVRRTIALEVGRIALDDIDEDKRDGIRAELVRLVDALDVPLLEASGNPSPTPPEAMPDAIAEPIADGIPDAPTYARAQPLPLSPSPALVPTSGGSGDAAAPPIALRGFDEWWEVYPRKVGKEAAKAAWRKALKKTTLPVLMDGVTRFRNDPTREDRFTCNPATWLNEGRWDDEGPARPGAEPTGTGRLAYSDDDYHAGWDTA